MPASSASYLSKRIASSSHLCRRCLLLLLHRSQGCDRPSAEESGDLIAEHLTLLRPGSPRLPSPSPDLVHQSQRANLPSQMVRLCLAPFNCPRNLEKLLWMGSLAVLKPGWHQRPEGIFCFLIYRFLGPFLECLNQEVWSVAREYTAVST